MVLGVLQFELAIHDAQSIKDKRRVVNSLRDRLHREHLVSVAQIGALDVAHTAVMAVAVVAAEGKRVADVLDAVEHKLRALRDAELVAIVREAFPAPPMGALAESNARLAGDGQGLESDDDLKAELLRHAMGGGSSEEPLEDER